MRGILFHQHTREELNRMAKEGVPVVVPLAATEQHAPHLPVFTDALICEYIVQNAAKKASETMPILVAPTLPIGCSDHHLRFGGTISFKSSTYLQILTDIGESLITDGFKKIIFVNGHGGNDPQMRQVANDLAVRFPVWTAAASYWTAAQKAFQEANVYEVGPSPGHAGGFETALIMALRNEWIDHKAIPQEHETTPWLFGDITGFIGKHGVLTGFDGYTDAPVKATPELGRKYLNAIVDAVAEWFIKVNRTMDEHKMP